MNHQNTWPVCARALPAANGISGVFLRCFIAPLVATLFHLQTEKASLQAGLCLKVCTEWLEKGELFNFKCFNKAKEMSIENTSLKFCARTVGPHTLCLGGWEVA